MDAKTFQNGNALIPVFDRQAALQRIDGDEAFLTTLIDLVLDEIPGNIAQLRLALEERQVEAIGDCAHGIKGTASAVGAMDLADIAARIERVARAGQFSEAEVWVDQLNEGFARFRSAVQPGLSV